MKRILGRMAPLVVTWLFMAGAPAFALAQSAPSPDTRAHQAGVYELVLRDGSRLFGSVEREDDLEVTFKTQRGAVVTTRRSEIVSLKEVSGSVVDGEFLRADPNATRLFFGPTGRSLKKGQTYLGVYEFVMPFVQVGLTDRLSVGGGTPLVFGIDEWERPFWVTPKLQVFDSQKTQVAVGVFHAFDIDGDGGGVGYVTATHGSVRSSFTAGAGMAYGTDGGRSGIVMLGGERQVRRNLKLISENYVWKNGDGITSAGVRFFGERLSADLALAFPIGADVFFGFPVVNFVYVF